jgi:hypothetical protein
VQAKADLNADGSEMILTTSLPDVDEIRIPFGALTGLSGPPVLVNLPGDAEHEPVLAVLANLDIQAVEQSEEPFGAALVRGDPAAALAFLPLGKDIVFGMGKNALSRFGNNIWHTQLRADDGSHPLPDEENKKGTWSKVTMTPENGKIRLKLEGDIPLDSPIIDIVPDPHVTITLLLTPKVAEGKLTFDISTDTDVDMGLLGDLLAVISGGIAGGILGFIVGLFTGALLAGLLWGAGIGLVVGVIALEIVEVVVEGIVQKEIRAKINGKPVADVMCNHQDIVQIATPVAEGGFGLSLLDTVPSSILIHSEDPEGEILYRKHLLVTSLYDDLKVDANGLAVAGASGTAEKFEPKVASLETAAYDGDNLVSLTFARNGRIQELSFEEVLQRASEGELKAPFKLFLEPEDAALRVPEGRLPCICLTPLAIQQVDTVVQEIEFPGGLRLKVPDAVALQDAAALIVTGYQLIHPRDYDPYYRAKADFYKDNNFESLPKY